jgi:hypothetical protein
VTAARGRRPTRASLRSRSADLRRLEALRFTFGAGPAREKRERIARLARARFARASEVLRLHEALVFARAYPDDAPLLRLVERALRGFAARRDVRALRAKLADSGIAGTEIRYRFFAPTALRLARRWPPRLRYDWGEWDDPARLEELLPLLAHRGEEPGLDEYDLGLRGWLERMKARTEGDAAFVMRRLAHRIPDSFVFERLVDGMDAPMVLAAGPGGPSRTLARWPGSPAVFVRAPLDRSRPDLAAEIRRPPLSVEPVPRRDAERLIELAIEAMVTRGRDLDVFAYADPADVRMVDCGEGLQFACMGARPERRLLTEAVYGFLTLKSGVPTGYVLTSTLFRSAEIAYNVFETYRGGEAAKVYGRVLATTAHLFGADSFTIPPYQLGGAGNEEGLESGAWWFYRKLGFQPHDRDTRALASREQARIVRNRAHRSSRAVLAELGEHNLYWHAGRSRDDVLGLLPLANLGLAVTDLLARRFGGESDRGAAACEREAAAVLGAGPTRDWNAGERAAFVRWAPLVLLLPGLSRWGAAERRGLLEVIRAKGGVRDSEFVRRFDAHARLRHALASLARRTRA